MVAGASDLDAYLWPPIPVWRCWGLAEGRQELCWPCMPESIQWKKDPDILSFHATDAICNYGDCSWLPHRLNPERCAGGKA